MMRSLFSGISGLKVHQTRMDVIGNNISNVNTVGFRASTVNFTDVFYQTTQGASGPNSETQAAGTNAKQIGLGANVAAIAVDLSGTGATQRTDRGMDVMINGDAFFVCQQNGNTLFTKSGALDVDANGTLYCTTNGASILGWRAIEKDDGDRVIQKDSVKTLNLMSPENSYSEPHATEKVTLKGNIDSGAEDVQVGSTGYPISVSFYDKLGELKSAKFSVVKSSDASDSTYTLSLTDITDSDGKSLLVEKNDDGKYVFTPMGSGNNTIMLNGQAITIDPQSLNEETGEFDFAQGNTWPTIKFDGSSGEFTYVGDSASQPISTNPDVYQGSIKLALSSGVADDPYIGAGTNNNGGIDLDFSPLSMYAQDGVCSVKPARGDAEGLKSGNPAGSLTGFSVSAVDGSIVGNYSNGDKKLLGQIAVATFANPSGLEAQGNSLFAATMNSGEFDGIGIDISEVGSFSVGALEMSDVDLANEFTTMITTQRGFQANSRVITTSDSMLEELVNLKR